MALAYVVLQTGRDVEMTSLAIRPTYGGLLEGYPHPRMNDAILAGLARRDDVRRPPPKHVIQPARTRPEKGREHAFGPLELLPNVICTAGFVSHPIDEDADTVLYRSWLTVSWFQESISEPIEQFVSAAIAELDWDRLAEDFEI